MLSILAQVAGGGVGAFGGYSIVQLLIIVIVIVAAIAITIVIVRAMGMEIPGWVFTVAWILVAVFVGVIALKFLASMF
jgi:hypothetical protein